MPNQNRKPTSGAPIDVWRNFLQEEKKTGSKLSQVLERSEYGGYDSEDKILSLFFAEDSDRKSAQGKRDKLQQKLKALGLPCTRISFVTGNAPVLVETNISFPIQKKVSKADSSEIKNPLQALNLTPFEDETGLSQPILFAAAKAEEYCGDIYEKMKKRTEALVGEDGKTIVTNFSWRVRVGGMRGFRELLLPAFHPVFGIPYIPASTLKGAARAWARKQSDKRLQRLFGVLDGKLAIAARVEFLDAFPVAPCLSVDVSTPQWLWQHGAVVYKPEPHALLSLDKPTFCIGIRPSTRGNADDVEVASQWLKKALQQGIGSRVSGGYGRSLGANADSETTQHYDFELWTQGMYGVEPPSRANRWSGIEEFRPTALRGIMRYWFRAIALGLYPADIVQNKLESQVFGELSKPGKVSTYTRFESRQENPRLYSGKIYLEAEVAVYRNLAIQVLRLAANIGGMGRGSRRPLHRLDVGGRRQWRGCHWSINSDDFSIAYSKAAWQALFDDILSAFSKIEAIPNQTHQRSRPQHKTNKRTQDILSQGTQIWLLKSPGLCEPSTVKDWETEGMRIEVRGEALQLMYDNKKFKGLSPDGGGNSNVGGKLGVPSFVWIKSHFPLQGTPYQSVAIFGVNQHPDRQAFATAIKNAGGLLVYS